MEPVSERTTVDRSGYAQEQTEVGLANSSSTKNSNQLQKSRTDRALSGTSTTAKTSNTKTHIAFGLSFTIKIANRTPFDPNHRC